ncbi:MAG: hypothetical protein IKB98_08710 [Clostridia bacterium]|jgi:stage III sporulation protein AD|nr:hypothetical protein [Clostridia bacterium]
MVKLVAIVIVCAIIIVYLKSINSDLTSLAILGSGIIVLSYAFQYVYQTYTFLSSIINLTGINSEYYSIIFKITAIGYLIEFGAGTVEDLGLKSLADKLVFAGKACIIVVSLPIIYAIFNLLSGLN